MDNMALSGASCKTAPGPTCVSPCEAVSQNGDNCACKSRTCRAPGLTLLFKVEYKSVATAQRLLQRVGGLNHAACLVFVQVEM
jgi:hypothetical protein